MGDASGVVVVGLLGLQEATASIIRIDMNTKLSVLFISYLLLPLARVEAGNLWVNPTKIRSKPKDEKSQCNKGCQLYLAGSPTKWLAVI